MISRPRYPLLISLVLLVIGNASAYDWTCNLFCYNKGVCRHGHGKFGSYAGIDSVVTDLPFEEELHDDGMYCTCPEGYTGLQCEIKLVTCDRDNHVCFNGSTCVKERSTDNGNVFYRCECDMEGSIMTAPYAEKYCAHIATVFCDGSDGFEHGTSYCTNGGRCKNRQIGSDKLVGCECPTGWEGSHCQTKVQLSIPVVKTEIVKELEEFLSPGEIAGIAVGLPLGIALVLYFRKHGFRRSRRGRERGITNFRRRGRKQQEMISYTDASNEEETHDII
eukprot:jgi/Psemu1/253901/estExt_Genewise1Plus.C_820028